MKKILIIITLLALTGIYFLPRPKIPEVFIATPTPAVKYANFIAGRIAEEKPINLLLLGYGGGTHEGAYLTDTMILTQIDIISGSITLITIPRDIWIKIPTDSASGSFWKINAAYTIGMNDEAYSAKPEKYKGKTGGGNLSKDMLEKVTGITPDRFVAIDFSAFKRVIDTLGGIDVKVEKTFDDFAYPITGKENEDCPATASAQMVTPLPDNFPTLFPCRYEHIHYDAGLMHMDGESALKFARSRHSLEDGSDFGRSVRQKNVLTAVKKKLLSPAVILKIIPLFLSLQNHVITDLSLDEINALLQMRPVFEKFKIDSIALTDTNILTYSFAEDGQYILVPKDGLDNWDSVGQWLKDEIYKAQNTAIPVIQIENGTDINGLAELASLKLKDKNIAMLPAKNSDRKNVQKTSITVMNPKIDKSVISLLEDQFQTGASFSAVLQPQDFNILVILGNDFRNKFSDLEE